MKDKETQNKVFDILDKFEFFQGQRAGRELWNNKPKEVQDKDIADFIKDINYIRSYLQDNVVLSKEEFSKALTDNFNIGKKEAQFYSERVAIPTTRKETAEKIYTFVNSFGTHNWERFEEFIKQFGVEIKE